MLNAATSAYPESSFDAASVPPAVDCLDGRPDIRSDSIDPDGPTFIRHPRGVPLYCREVTDPEPASVEVNGGEGCGICFEHPHRLAPGRLLDLTFVVLDQKFRFQARVCWIRCTGPGYEVGIAFRGAAERYRARMVEQICHIEAYREAVALREGRALSGDVAAAEWISRYAASFPAV